MKTHHQSSRRGRIPFHDDQGHADCNHHAFRSTICSRMPNILLVREAAGKQKESSKERNTTPTTLARLTESARHTSSSRWLRPFSGRSCSPSDCLSGSYILILINLPASISFKTSSVRPDIMMVWTDYFDSAHDSNPLSLSAVTSAIPTRSPMAQPSFAKRRISSWISNLAPASMPRVGSSKRKSGSSLKPWCDDHLCSLPPERSMRTPARHRRIADFLDVALDVFTPLFSTTRSRSVLP